MTRLLLPAIILYSLLFVHAPLVPQSLRSLFGAGQRIEKLCTGYHAEPSAGPSSRAANWDSSRTDNQFRRKCIRFRRSLADLRVYGDEEIVIRRGKIFEDTFTKTIGFDTQRWKNEWTISFKDERAYGIGVKREWYTALMRSTVDTKIQLFVPSDGDRDAYTINPHKSASDATLRRFLVKCTVAKFSYSNTARAQIFQDHLRFIGRIVAKAVYDGQLLPMYFTRSMYKHILGKQVDCTDLEIEDPRYYRSLQFIRENDVGQFKATLGQSLKWVVEVVEGGKTVERELRPRGRNMKVTNDEREDYVQRVCEMKLHTVIEKQLGAFLTGFYEIIPKTMISIFNEREFELVISGPPVIDIDDWQANTEYNRYDADSQIIVWFWETLRSFSQEQLGQLLHFVTGSSKPPLRGFAYLDGNAEGSSKFKISRGDDVLKAVVCYYKLILPSGFESKEHLEQALLAVIGTSSHGFNVL